MFDDTDLQTEFYLREHFVPWRDQIVGVKEFLEEIAKKELLEVKKDNEQNLDKH